MFEGSLGQHLPGMERNPAPVSYYLHKALKAPLAEVLPQDDDYDQAFDRFGYLLALIRADLSARERVSDYFYERPGRFSVKNRLRHEAGVMAEVKKQAEDQGNQWVLLKAGFFEGTYDRFVKVVKGCEENSREAFTY